jgi:hypothetical protein
MFYWNWSAFASSPFVTKALAELQGMSLEYGENREDSTGALNTDVIKLSQRFANLMGEYNYSIADGVISLNEARRLLEETNSLQQALMDMKLHLQSDPQHSIENGDRMKGIRPPVRRPDDTLTAARNNCAPTQIWRLDTYD